jgi:hypothetical protein
MCLSSTPPRHKFAPAPFGELATHAAQILVAEMRKYNNGADQQEQECDFRIHRSASSKEPLEGGAYCIAKSIPKLKNRQHWVLSVQIAKI